MNFKLGFHSVTPAALSPLLLDTILFLNPTTASCDPRQWLPSARFPLKVTPSGPVKPKLDRDSIRRQFLLLLLEDGKSGHAGLFSSTYRLPLSVRLGNFGILSVCMRRLTRKKNRELVRGCIRLCGSNLGTCACHDDEK